MTPERVLRNGIPTWWADGPEPFAMALHFRVGHADETMQLSGVTHLVEHLVMGAAGRREHPHNAWVDAGHCVFVAEGEREEVLEYLTLVGQAVAAIDLDGLDHERRVLRVEAAQRAPSLLSRMLMARFGLAGYGLGGDDEYGLRWIGEDEVRAWWTRHYTRGNAALWLLGEPPDDLGFELPDGPRIDPPEPVQLPTSFPAFMADGTGGVVLTGLVTRAAAANVAISIATERLYERLRQGHGVSYAPHSDYLPLGPDLAHVMLGSDGRDEVAAMLLRELWGCAQEMAEDGVTDEELDRSRRAATRALKDPQSIVGELGFHVRTELAGLPYESREQLEAERAAVDGPAVAQVMRELLEQAFLLGPDGSRAPAGLEPFTPPPMGEPEGERFQRPRPGRLKRRPQDELWIGERSLGWHDPDDGMSIAWDNVAAGEMRPDGQLRVIARDGRWLGIAPYQWEDGDRAVALARARVGEALILPPTDRALSAAIDAAVRRRITDVAALAKPLDALPYGLSEDEELLDLAAATRGSDAGLLVLTGRRIMWLAANESEQVVIERDEVQTEVHGGELALVYDDETLRLNITPKTAARELVALISAPG